VQAGGGAGAAPGRPSAPRYSLPICATFTALSEATEPAAVIAALDAWFDRIAGAVHAFGGEVLKFIGDGRAGDFPGHLRAG